MLQWKSRWPRRMTVKAREKKEISEKWTSHCTPFRKERAKATSVPPLHTTTPHDLALSRRIILDVTSHGWVLAGHPRYTRAQFAEKAVGGSTTTRTRHDRVHSSHVKVDRMGPSWSTHRWRREGIESCWRSNSGREAVARKEAEERRKVARETAGHAGRMWQRRTHCSISKGRKQELVCHW